MKLYEVKDLTGAFRAINPKYIVRVDEMGDSDFMIKMTHGEPIWISEGEYDLLISGIKNQHEEELEIARKMK